MLNVPETATLADVIRAINADREPAHPSNGMTLQGKTKTANSRPGEISQ